MDRKRHFLFQIPLWLALLCLLTLAGSAQAQSGGARTTLGGVDLGDLTDYLFFFADGSEDANWQAASKGFVGDVAVDGIQADERTSGTVPYAGTIYTNDTTLDAWQDIVDDNAGQASGVTGQVARINDLEADLASAFTQINALAATTGYTSVASGDLDGLNTQNNVSETFVINITSDLQVSDPIEITGDAGDIFILRWDTDGNPANGYQGQTKFQSGGAIVPLGGLKPTNFINVAGDINASGGGSTPAAPYPQGPRLNDGQGALIAGGQDFSGGGFFTGYWLTTGDPADGNSSSLSNAIFVGGWYTTADSFSMTSGTSGVHVEPPLRYTLGNQIWADQNGGTTGIKDPAEPGIPGVLIELYRDSDGSGGYTASDQLIGSTTTDGNGLYSFSDLPEGDYYILLPTSNFNVGGALATYNGPTTFAGDPDNNVDNDSNGQLATIPALVVLTPPITLANRAEPSGSGLVNNTLDIGFVQGGQTAVTLRGVTATPAAGLPLLLLALLLGLTVAVVARPARTNAHHP